MKLTNNYLTNTFNTTPMGSKIQRPASSIAETFRSGSEVSSVEERTYIEPVFLSLFTPNEDLSVMLRSAELGEWGLVFDFIEKKPELINQIPNDKEWSVLHWAAYKNHYTAISRVLKYSNCDSAIKTNPQTAANILPQIPASLTQLPDLESLLINHFRAQDNLTHDFPTILNPFFKDYAISHCIDTAFRQYAGILFPEDLNLNRVSFVSLMKEVYKYISLDSKWLDVRNSLSMSVSSFHTEIGRNILYETTEVSGDTAMRDLFFSRLLKLFIQNRHCLYRLVNQVICSTEDDVTMGEHILSLAPYALVLNSIILSSPSLDIPKHRTYLIVEDESDAYRLGSVFVWFSFVLCSSREPILLENGDSKKYIVVEISNWNCWKWTPKYIGGLSESGDFDYLYPFGAKFKVTDRTEGKMYLQLLNF